MTDFYLLIQCYPKNRVSKWRDMFDQSVFLRVLIILHSQFYLFFALITTTEQHTATAFIYPVSSDHTSAGNKIAKGISFILNAYGTNNFETNGLRTEKFAHKGNTHDITKHCFEICLMFNYGRAHNLTD